MLEGSGKLTYAAMSQSLDDLNETTMNELAELVIPTWNPVGSFVPDATASLSAEHEGVHFLFVRVEQVGRCLFSIQPTLCR